MARGLAPTVEQQQALTGLVTDGTLSDEQAAAVRAALFTPEPARPATNPVSILIEILGYVGGGLILGGAMLLVGLNLSRLGERDAAQVLAGYAVGLLVAGILIGGGPRRAASLRHGSAPVRRRLVGVLLAIATVPASLSAALFETGHGRALLFAGLVGLVVAIAGYALLPTVPGLLAITGASITATNGGLELAHSAPRLASTFAFVGLGSLIGIVAAVGLLRPRHIGLALGAGVAIVGAHLAFFVTDARGWGYGLTFLIGLICFLSYWLDRSTVLLVFGVLATSVAIPEAVTDWTDDSLSGPAILLISGTVLVAASGLGVWLRNLRQSTVDNP